MKPLLQAKDLHKTFSSAGSDSVQILNGVSLTLYPGKSIAIIGKSGSGKSSLLHILGTLDAPSSGTLTICEKQAFLHARELRSKKIGFVFQSFHLLEDYTLLENILIPARIARKNTKPSSELFLRAQKLLEFVGLLERAKAPAKLLSGGEKQRASIARALFNDPDILLVDEPTGNLDPVNAALVQKLLLSSCKEQNKSLILVTHDEEFASLCDEVFLLKNGKLTKL
jgi:lipoprotein-releasing system ATP-binding protein